MSEQTNSQQTNIEDLSFEDALKELETIVRNLESGQVALDDAINAYERGAKLKQHCAAKLAEAQTRVQSITLNADGTANATDTTIE